MQSELLELLRDLQRGPLAQNHGQLAQRIGDICLGWDAKLDEQELEHVFNIVEMLVARADRPVRCKLAEHLSIRNDVPHDLLLSLANDDINVAYSLLVHSKLLGDDELAGIIDSHGREHALSIAQRGLISPIVSENLVETNDSAVVIALLHNDGAEFSEETYRRLADKAIWEPQYRAPIVSRSDLSPQLAGHLYAWVGDTQRQLIEQRFKFGVEELDGLMARALGDLEESTNAKFSSDELKRISSARIARTSDMLLQHLRKGRLTQFEQDLCEIMGLSRDVVYRALHKQGVSGVAILCRSYGFASAFFSEAYVHLHSGPTNALVRTSEQYKKAITYFSTLKPDAAQRMLRILIMVPADPDD